ncbi:hypothetical protein SDC9_185962 [bioreactor metagenome]|uniref:Uncharacterized protein n=1 Tax=bioreactor metagenome TaxID=1076179 RepID=A0A645HHC6_9ZZZZ
MTNGPATFKIVPLLFIFVRHRSFRGRTNPSTILLVPKENVRTNRLLDESLNAVDADARIAGDPGNRHDSGQRRAA